MEITKRQADERGMKRRISLAASVGVLAGLAACTSGEQPADKDNEPTKVVTTDKCGNIQGVQLQVPERLVVYEPNSCVTPEKRQELRREDRHFRHQQAQTISRLQEAQHEREQRLKQALNALPKSARAMAVAGIYCTDDTIGGGLQQGDGAVERYSQPFIARQYEINRAAGPSDLPADLYGVVVEFCPEQLGSG